MSAKSKEAADGFRRLMERVAPQVEAWIADELSRKGREPAQATFDVMVAVSWMVPTIVRGALSQMFEGRPPASAWVMAGKMVADAMREGGRR